MRVSMKFNAIPSSCENFAYGEVEDYTLNFITPPPPPPVADFSGNPLSVITGGIVQFMDLSDNEPTSWLWTFEGGSPGTSDVQNPSITYNTPGTYDVTLFVSNAAGSDILTLENYITVTQPGSCQDNYEPNETMAAAKAIPVNTDVFALISATTDTDWFKFTTAGSAKNIKITLTNLPADYNIKLYKSDGTLIGSSINTGVISELIIYNTNKAGTYNINVFGNEGVFNPNDCYTLRAEVSSTAFKSIDAESIDPAINEELTVYPNPSNSTFNLRLQTASDELLNLRLFDISGRMIEEYQSLPPTEVITIGENLEIGVYIAVVRQGTLQKIVKIAKVR